MYTGEYKFHQRELLVDDVNLSIKINLGVEKERSLIGGFHKHIYLSFRDFLLYVSPIFVILFLPDEMAVHFLHYFIYIRILHYHENRDELYGIDEFFDHYYQHLVEHYGPKSELCTIHIHSHLLAQVKHHGALSMTSCFPRESYMGTAIKWCPREKAHVGAILYLV